MVVYAEQARGAVRALYTALLRGNTEITNNKMEKTMPWDCLLHFDF